jgi:dolichyl-diphosphooligosaccharide--protein glycosyltransferase
MDLQMLIFLFPAGVILCFKELRDEHLFVIIYAVMASYFAGVMVRLMLTLTPVVCVASAIALSSMLDVYLNPVEPDAAAETTSEDTVSNGPSAPAPSSTPAASKKGKKAASDNNVAPTNILSELAAVATGVPAGKSSKKDKSKPGIFGLDSRLVVLLNTTFLLVFFVLHCTWVTSIAYSSPSVILSSQNQDGSMHIIDDYREAYYWLRQNTAPDSVIMSWWDYGYQIAGMADRPTLVDNNTWNNSTFLPFPRRSVTHHLRPYSPHRHCRQSHVQL